MKHHQLLLFPRSEIPKPEPGPLLHRWLWFPFRESECARCYAIWPTGASIMEMATQECPGQALDMAFNDYSDVYLVWLGG